MFLNVKAVLLCVSANLSSLTKNLFSSFPSSFFIFIFIFLRYILDPLSDSVRRSYQSLRETSGTDQWNLIDFIRWSDRRTESTSGSVPISPIFSHRLWSQPMPTALCNKHTDTHTHTLTHTHTQTFTDRQKHAHTCTLHTHAHTLSVSLSCTHTHTYIHTHTRTRTTHLHIHAHIAVKKITVAKAARRRNEERCEFVILTSNQVLIQDGLAS